MDISIDVSDLSDTDTFCSENIPDSNTNYQDIFANIEERIWRHTNKKRFFEKTSIEHYLKTLSTIQPTDDSLKHAVDYYTRQLEKLNRELDEYQDTAENLNNVSINLDNLTEDQNILKNVHNPVNHEKLCVLTEIPSEELNSVTNIAESLFTNNNFEYSNSKIFNNENIPPNHETIKNPEIKNFVLEPESVAKPTETHEPQRLSKKRKFLEADLLEDINFTFANREKLNEDINTNTILETEVESKEFDSLDEMEAIKVALKSHKYEKLYEIPNSTFINNPEISTIYLDHFKSLMGSFQSFFLEKLDKIIEDREQEEFTTEIRGRRRQSNIETTKPDSVKPSPAEMPLTGTPMSLEDLSEIFTHMYENLSIEDDKELD